MEIQTAKYRCHKCGQEVDFHDTVCAHCGAITKYGESLINVEKEHEQNKVNARGYCRVVLIWCWILVLLLPPIGFCVSIRGLVMATLARYRGLWAFILALLVAMGLTALYIVLIILAATGQLK